MTRDFSGQRLRGRSFKGQDLTGANFSRTQIQGANFAHAVLTGANFCGARAGAKHSVMALLLLLMGLSGLTVGLFGNAIADTVNSSYLHYFGPRDATIVFCTFFTFSFLLLARDLITAVVATVLGGLIVWFSLFLWEFSRTHKFLASLVGQESSTSDVIVTINVFWLGLSVVPTLCAVLMASAHFQSHHRQLPGRFEITTLLCALAMAIPGAVSFAGVLAKINAPLDAIILWSLSLHITGQILRNHSRYTWLRSAALALSTWGSTCFQQTQLQQANFLGARLSATDFTGAQLIGTRFYGAHFLDYARAGTTLLNQPEVCQLLVDGQVRQSYAGCNLRGAYLAKTALTGADFTNADLSQADFTGAQLDDAIFTRAQVIGTCFREAQMTGSCIESWNIDTTTQIDGVVCDYIYLIGQRQERRPSDGQFEPGDFSKLFQDVLHTVDLIFRQGLDMSALMSAFQQVRSQSEEIALRSIENKGDGVVVVKVEVPEDTPKPALHSALTQAYDQALRQIEARYQAALAAKDEQITLYRQHQSELSQLTRLLSQPAVRVTVPIPGKRAVLKLGQLEKMGIPVTLQLGNEGALPQLEVTGWLPAGDLLLATQQRWQIAYRQVYRQSTRIDVSAVQITNISYQELFEGCRGADLDLTGQINDWFNSKRFQPVRDALLSALDPTDSIRLVLQTNNLQIRALPLHLWEWFERYTRAELVLSEPIYRQATALETPSNQVKILAILGDGRGLDIQRDRYLLEQLPDVSLTCLVEPMRSQLNDSLWEQPWDILFFAGHSSLIDQRQKLRINSTEGLALSELKYALRTAIERGLKLAIFNACDGLQLIQELSADLSLPPTIVMRHPVPDIVAQAFLKHFLTAFSQGSPLHQAVREARERLQGLESQFPFATWLPVLCQNPAALPLTWERLKGSED